MARPFGGRCPSCRECDSTSRSEGQACASASEEWASPSAHLAPVFRLAFRAPGSTPVSTCTPSVEVGQLRLSPHPRRSRWPLHPQMCRSLRLSGVRWRLVPPSLALLPAASSQVSRSLSGGPVCVWRRLRVAPRGNPHRAAVCLAPRSSWEQTLVRGKQRRKVVVAQDECIRLAAKEIDYVCLPADLAQSSGSKDLVLMLNVNVALIPDV